MANKKISHNLEHKVLVTLSHDFYSFWFDVLHGTTVYYMGMKI